MHSWIHTLRLWLWRRRAWALARECRPTGTNEADWIAANVASMAGGAGSGVS